MEGDVCGGAILIVCGFISGEWGLLDIHQRQVSWEVRTGPDGSIFTDEEMAACCFSAGKRATKPQLPHEKIKLLEGMFYRVLCQSRKD